MEDVRHAQNLRGFQDGAGEKGEALGIVGIVTRCSAVERIAIKKLWILDKIEAHTGLATSGDDRRETILVVKWDRDAPDNSCGFSEFGLAVARQVDGHLMPERGQRARQGAHYISQSAGLGERDAFGSNESDVHESKDLRSESASF